MEGGAVHKSGGKGAALARATHRRVINYYPVRRARDTLPSSPRRATAYAAALTLLSLSPPSLPPAPDVRQRVVRNRGAAPIRARFYTRRAAR